MKQFQVTFQKPEDSVEALHKLREQTGPGQEDHLLFQLFSRSLERYAIEYVCKKLENEFPGAAYVGCSTAGSIIEGDLSTDTYALVCTLFESPTAKVDVKQYRLDMESVDGVMPKVVSFANENSWVKAILFYTTVWKTSMTKLCTGLDEVRSDVHIMGGGAFNAALDSFSSYVLSNGGNAADHSIVFVFIGGDDLVVNSRYISGWKPLGKYMDITKAMGNVLQEIDGVSAFNIYHRYLKIENDDTFLYNTLEFPYIIKRNGIDILRHPQQCLKDGSLVMASDVENTSKIRLAYGDPVTIMESIYQNIREIRKEDPDVIMIFSCAGRKAFWGDNEIGNETKAFETIAPSSGFYTISEFLRTDDNVNQHNLTLVLATLKEMIPGRKPRKKTSCEELHGNKRLSTVERLANFIEQATSELETANEQLSDMNQKLSNMAITDGLTQLLNRGEIQRRITEAAESDSRETVSLVMMDIDNFKKVNDTFGHNEGDNVIRTLAEVMKKQTSEIADASAGRWGGEEFMILLPGMSNEKAFEIAEAIRKAFSDITFPLAGNCTISLGVAERQNPESGDSLASHADQALYNAKNTGKNKTVIY